MSSGKQYQKYWKYRQTIGSIFMELVPNFENSKSQVVIRKVIITTFIPEYGGIQMCPKLDLMSTQLIAPCD